MPEEKTDKAAWNEVEWGKLAYRVFDHCPVCQCPARFAVEAMKGEMTEDVMKNKPPAMGAFQLSYAGTVFNTTLDVVVDSCCKCGAIYTIARSKRRRPAIMMPRGKG